MTQREGEYELYLAFSYIAHGTVAGIDIVLSEAADGSLQRQAEEGLRLNVGRFVIRTDGLIQLAYGPIITPETQRCTDDWSTVLRLAVRIS